MRVVLDTNIVISALLFGGAAEPLVTLWQSQQIQMLASAAMIKEYARVLSYPKFQMSASEAKSILEQDILPFVQPVRVLKVENAIPEDPSDNEFLACARAGNADFIVSGDHHLLKLKGYRQIPIVSLSEFLKVI